MAGDELLRNGLTRQGRIQTAKTPEAGGLDRTKHERGQRRRGI
jgi:hypothetical protein